MNWLNNLKEWWYFNMSWYICDTIPHRIVDWLSKVSKKLSPWFKPKRKLMNEFCNNNHKLLSDTLSTVYYRTRDGEIKYYFLTTRFGRVKLFEEVMIDKKTNESCNVFLTNIVNVFSDENHMDEYDYQSKCIYKGWAFTQEQAKKCLNDIINLTPNLDWEECCDEKMIVDWLNSGIKYLKTGKSYWTVNGGEELDNHKYTKSEAEDYNEAGFRFLPVLLARDVKNLSENWTDIRLIGEKVLEKKSKKRDNELLNMMTQFKQKLVDRGYKTFK